jgi:predicted Rossmann fold flavoprotein
MTYRKGGEQFDVVVVGGGPAGMMAAGRAAELGARVLLLEKNEMLGKKLLITGGGRCNLTNAEFDVRKWTEKFGEKGKFLFPALSRFGVRDTLDFFHARDLPTKVEEENRVFPTSDSAQDVWRVMTEYVKDGRVTVRYRSAVDGFETQDGRISGVRANGEIVSASKYVLATGGRSRPETGSTGEGFRWLKAIGHAIADPDPALVPVRVAESWIKELQGLSFGDAELGVWQGGRKLMARRGKVLLTHFGLSGPLALNMSRDIRECFKRGETALSLDIFPELDATTLDRKVQEVFQENQNKRFKNSLDELLPAKMVPAIVRLSGVDPEKAVNVVTREERLRLAGLLKGLRLTVAGFLGFGKAIVTSGGVSLEEVDFKTMQSRLFPNLCLVGDVLDFNRPSGGYSLQICWTTGRIAGEHAAPIRI